MFSQLENWDAEILASRLSHMNQTPLESDAGFKTVWVTKYRGNGPSRVANWLSYTVTACFAGLRRPADVVYGSSPHMGAAVAAAAIASLRRKPFVLEIRDLWPHMLAESGMLSNRSKLFRALKKLERALYRRAEHIVVLAEGSIGYIVSEGISSDKITFIPNGADPSDFAVTADRSELRRQFGFSGLAAVYAGAHGPANGLDFVLDAAEVLASSEVEFHMFGDGPSKDALQRAASERRLTNLRFHEPVPKREMPSVLAAADVGVHCLADHELFRSAVSPNKVYDYMAAGLPVVTNTEGEVTQIVEACGAGFGTPVDGLHHGLLRLQALNNDQRQQLGRNGIDWMNQNRTRALMASRLESVLESTSA